MTEASERIYVGVIDDDESLRRALVRLLRAAGFCVIGYGSAEDFLGDQKRPVFNCLVLDVQLDGMSGTELARKLADSGSKIPVIFLSAAAPEEVAATIPSESRSLVMHKGQPGSLLLDAINTSVCPSSVGAEAVSK